MLNRLELHGYRGFEAHEMDLRQLSVIVGHNNAGKSTIVEVLRIFSIITERLGGLNFHDPPAWTNLPLACRGLSPSLDGLGIQFSTISHRYGEDPASAKATFTGGESIDLFVDSEGPVFRCASGLKKRRDCHEGTSHPGQLPFHPGPAPDFASRFRRNHSKS